jgi:hypothetical protein
LLLFTFCFTACNRCGKDFTAYDSGISFILLDNITSQNLLGFGGEYHIDSVKIYSQEGKTVFKGPVELSGIIDLTFADKATDYSAVDAPLNKIFYIYLNHLDTDTLTTQFQLRKDECGKDQLLKLNVLYNGLLMNFNPTSNIYEMYK